MQNNTVHLWNEIRSNDKGGRMIGEEILLEIDGTLDRLIQNAEAIEHADLTDLNETEIDAFQNTQESLLQHLLHMDQYLVIKKHGLKKPSKYSANLKIQEKLLRFEKMKMTYHKNISDARKKLPILSKRRKKRLLCFAK